MTSKKKVGKKAVTVEELLARFGLGEREREVYLLLIRRGWSTALQLARVGSVKRTTLYRILDSLEKKGLVETQLDDKTTYYNAADPKQFESLVIVQEIEAKKMRQTFKSLQKQLTNLSHIGAGETAVRFYRGVRGLQHMEWKMCGGKDYEIVMFGAAYWHKYLGEEFAEEIRAEMVKNKIRIRELMHRDVDEPFITHEDGSANWTDNQEYVLNHFRYRYVPEKMMKITQDIHVFKNIIQMRGYREHEVMGIEIVSDDYSKMFKDWFELIWSQAEKVDKFSEDYI